MAFIVSESPHEIVVGFIFVKNFLKENISSFLPIVGKVNFEMISFEGFYGLIDNCLFHISLFWFEG